MKKLLAGIFVVTLLLAFTGTEVRSTEDQHYWLKIRAKDKFERSALAYDVAIESVNEDYVIAYGSQIDRDRLESKGLLIDSLSINELKDFPQEDRDYHTYAELTKEMQDLAQRYPTQVRLTNIGKTYEGRDIIGMIVTSDLTQIGKKPALLLLGGHHSREHLSVETPFRFTKWYLEQANGGNARVQRLLQTRELHVLPAVNPDGLEYDISGNEYHYWRKNRRKNSDGTYGVDLNRNYGKGWGTTGISWDTTSDVFPGTSAFSEPESQAVKRYIDSTLNISSLISFHTFSELILYPWGDVFTPIENGRDQKVHQVMAEKMATWNNYTPEQSSELYAASGDMVDWAYDAHKIVGFTFELDPQSGFGGMEGFYPGAGVINPVLQKNIEPCLYLLEYADNPYRVLETQGSSF